MGQRSHRRDRPLTQQPEECAKHTRRSKAGKGSYLRVIAANLSDLSGHPAHTWDSYAKSEQKEFRIACSQRWERLVRLAMVVDVVTAAGFRGHAIFTAPRSPNGSDLIARQMI